MVTLTVTLHQWLQVDVGQLTWASQSLTQVSSVWCNHSNHGDLDCDLAPMAAGGGWTAELGLTVPHTGEQCNHSNQGDLALVATCEAHLGLPVPHTGLCCI